MRRLAQIRGRANVTTLGMILHIYLTATIVVPNRRTKNPIWGELVSLVLLMPIIVLWGAVATILGEYPTMPDWYVPGWHRLPFPVA